MHCWRGFVFGSKYIADIILETTAIYVAKNAHKSLQEYMYSIRVQSVEFLYVVLYVILYYMKLLCYKCVWKFLAIQP